MIADKSGRSVILEWTDGEMKVFERNGSYQVCVNYLIGKPQIPFYYRSLESSKERENIVSECWKKNNEVSIDNFAGILQKSAQRVEYQGTIYGTIYSNIYDLKNFQMIFFYKSDYTNKKTFNLLNEFKKGYKEYKVKDLF